jgi:hypothetical protein
VTPNLRGCLKNNNTDKKESVFLVLETFHDHPMTISTLPGITSHRLGRYFSTQGNWLLADASSLDVIPPMDLSIPPMDSSMSMGAGPDSAAADISQAEW